VTSVSARSRVACFSIHADAEPGVMPRVLELFAKRGLVPRRWISDVTGPGGGELSIDVQVAGMAPETQAQIAQCLRQVWGVGTVLTSEKGGG
jgi:acetolactate synthase small subunit